MKQKYSDPFQAVADTSRRQILQLLAKNPQSVNALAGNFNMSRPAVSRHIKLLYRAGFIGIEDKGRERLCSLKKDGFKQMQGWMDFFDTFWNNKLDALGSFLAAEASSPSPKRKSQKKIRS